VGSNSKPDPSQYIPLSPIRFCSNVNEQYRKNGTSLGIKLFYTDQHGYFHMLPIRIC
jgi:hypothetical protein